ncbi:MAG TPA: hypothetical protein VGM84_22355 [Steroidobacteraceae bacterium]|jgi:hypothetical protein
MRPSPTVSIESHAAATLRYIRASIEAAGGTVAVSGSASITAGIVGLVAAVVASAPSLRPYWLNVWLWAACVASVLGGGVMARQVYLQGFTLFGAPVRKFITCFAPGLFAGAVMTGVLIQAGSLSSIPGTWLLLYGCALFSTSAPTSRPVAALGGLFALLGLVTYFLPQTLHTVSLGAGFGGLHLVFGLLLHRRDRDREA